MSVFFIKYETKKGEFACEHIEAATMKKALQAAKEMACEDGDFSAEPTLNVEMGVPVLSDAAKKKQEYKNKLNNPSFVAGYKIEKDANPALKFSEYVDSLDSLKEEIMGEVEGYDD